MIPDGLGYGENWLTYRRDRVGSGANFMSNGNGESFVNQWNLMEGDGLGDGPRDFEWIWFTKVWL